MKSRLIALLWCVSSCTHAASWHDLLMNPDQLAAQWMEDKQYQKAAAQFKRLDWQATAYYRAGDFKKSASLFENLETADGFYNAGNAYARMGQFEKAIKAYDRALTMNPDDQDARFNRDLVMQLRNQQQKQQQQQQKEQQQQQKEEQESPPASKQPSDQPSGSGNRNQADSKQTPQTTGSDHTTQQNPSESQKIKSSKSEKNKQQDHAATTSQAAALQDTQEKQQAKKQWLHMIPEPPSSLLKEKFMRDYLKNKSWLD